MQLNPPQANTLPDIDALRRQFLLEHGGDLETAASEYARRAVNTRGPLPDCSSTWANLRATVKTRLERKALSLLQTRTHATWSPLMQTERDNFLLRIRDTFNRYRRGWQADESSWFREHHDGRRLLLQALLDVCNWIDEHDSSVSVISCLVSLSHRTCCSYEWSWLILWTTLLQSQQCGCRW